MSWVRNVRTCSNETSGKQHSEKDILLETQNFVLYGEETPHKNISFQTSLTIALEIILQNCSGSIRRISICEIVTEKSETDLTSLVSEILDRKPYVSPSFCKSNNSEINGKYNVILTEGPTDCWTLENLHDDGFIIYKGTLMDINKKCSFNILFHSTTPIDDLFLIRKPSIIDNDQEVFVNVKNEDFNWLEDLKTHMKDDNPKVVYLLSQCDNANGIIGLTNCLIREPSSCKFKFIFSDQKISIDSDFYKNQLRKNLVFNVLRAGKWGTYVYLPMEEITKRNLSNAAVQIRTVGDLGSLEWVESPPLYNESRENTAKADIFYSALNYRDILLATGKLKQFLPTSANPLLGMDFSGISEGKRIMGICFTNGIALNCQVDKNLMWEVPDKWSLEDAATVPLVYTMVYYSLIMRGQLQSGESILIHAGSGATGIAAITLALSLNCEVFTTVSTTEKKEFLKRMFPKLKDENFGNSRDNSFEKIIMKRTKGDGVNVILNSLSGELLEASLRCLSEGGRFLELGKTECLTKNLHESYILLRNCSFHAILMERICQGTVKIDTKHLQELVKTGITSGVIKPLPRTVFPESQVIEAFKFLSTDQHVGKVLIQVRKEQENVLTSPIKTIKAIPNLYFNSKKSYIITGGLGGVGLELANWMIQKGATNIVLNSRKGITNSYQKLCLSKWRKLEGIQIVICTENSSDIVEAHELIKVAERLGPVGGVFNLAVELRVKLMLNQTVEDFEVVFKSKVHSVKNLDELTRKYCKELDHFVAFSSVSCGIGVPGQSNYGMANSVLERICEERKLRGFPGLAVQYGLIGEVGIIQNVNNLTALLQNNEPQPISSCLNALEKFMLQSKTIVLSMALPDKREKSTISKEKTPAETVANLLGIKDISKIDPSSTMVQLGIDSLISAEIKQSLYNEFRIEKDVKCIQELTFGILLNWNTCNKNVKESVSKETSNKASSLSFQLPDRVIADLKVENSERKIFFLHPIEGHTNHMSPLARRLNADVYGLQCTADCKFETIEDFSCYYEKLIREKQPEEPYYLCGYSYGALLALEIAYIIESKGLVARVICIDGSPDYSKFVANEFYTNLESWNVHEKLLINFSMDHCQANEEQVTDILKNFRTEEEQTKQICRLLSELTGIGSTNLETLFSLQQARIKASHTYNPKYILNGPILFFRGVHKSYHLSEEYGLEKLCKMVNVVKLEAKHDDIILGDSADKIANIINEFIDVNYNRD